MKFHIVYDVILPMMLDTYNNYYRLGKNDYRFHEARLRANKELLSEDDYLTELLNMFSASDATTEPDAQVADPPSKPSDP